MVASPVRRAANTASQTPRDARLRAGRGPPDRGLRRRPTWPLVRVRSHDRAVIHHRQCLTALIVCPDGGPVGGGAGSSSMDVRRRVPIASQMHLG
jgi:hypothetical protein